MTTQQPTAAAEVSPPPTQQKAASKPKRQPKQEPVEQPTRDYRSIHERLIAVMADVRALGKNERVTAGPARYNFRGIDATVNAVGPAFRKHGIYVTSEIDNIAYADVLTSGDKRSTACRVIVSYTFTAVDGDSVTTTVAGEAWDHGDKGTPKAMSVALRTALLQMLALPTDEKDPDQDNYEQASFVDQVKKAATKEQAQAVWQRAKAAGASDAALQEIFEIGKDLPSATAGLEQTPTPPQGEKSAEQA